MEAVSSKMENIVGESGKSSSTFNIRKSPTGHLPVAAARNEDALKCG
jgi:hypothetical protein